MPWLSTTALQLYHPIKKNYLLIPIILIFYASVIVLNLNWFHMPCFLSLWYISYIGFPAQGPNPNLYQLHIGGLLI